MQLDILHLDFYKSGFNMFYMNISKAASQLGKLGGRKGGSRNTAAQKAARNANLVKARKKRWAKPQSAVKSAEPRGVGVKHDRKQGN
jgi:hypothetical protein